MYPLNLEKFSQIFTFPALYFYIGFSALNGVFLFFASLKFILALQQSGYNGKRYFRWLSNKQTPYLSRLMLLCLMGFLFFCVLNSCFVPVLGSQNSAFLGFVSYWLFTALYIKTESTVNAKIPLNKTHRIVRLSITYILMLTVISFGLLVLIDLIAYAIGNATFANLRYSLVCIMPILLPYILFIAHGVNQPFELFKKRRYVRRTKIKLDKSNVIKIGITGSYGKTSVKEILKTLFSQKYRVLATPKSYNTPLGICLATKGLDSTHDIFIAEFGARNKGDIKELTRLVNPAYAVLTGVNNQHLESFGSIENTIATKNEIFENLKEGGIGFFSCDNQISTELAEKFNGEKYTAGLADENSLVCATDITVSDKGTTFTLNIKGEEPIVCETTLLGEHNVSNICLAACVAYKIGLTKEEIAQGVNRLTTIEHRLELMPNQKNIVIIDDSYNSNIDGVKAAMKVLSTFTGRKIILTPGLVELGKEENVANVTMGKLIAEYADIVIVIGNHNAEMLISGLTEGGMSKENIMFAKSLKKGNEMLNEIVKEGDVVLFENDLPDNYN